MKLLLVGGNGFVGSLIRPALEAQHTCYYLGAKPVAGAEERSFAGDLHDESLIGKAIHGMDRIVWLEASSGGGSNGNSEEEGYTSNNAPNINSFSADVKALYRLLHIAQFAGVLRFIYASSTSVYANCGGRDDYPLHELVPSEAWDAAGLGERLSEAVGQACIHNRPECTFLALRLMLPHHETPHPENGGEAGQRSYPLGPNDMCRLFLAATAFDRLGYYALQATGDLEGKSFPNARATAVLGWQPQGD